MIDLVNRMWEDFEIEACDYLNKTYRGFATFTNEGGGNSNSTDIKVFKNDKYIFSIEAKFSPSQSGQIVLKEEAGKYILSSKSRGKDNKYTQNIINFLNENKSIYTPIKQNAMLINLDMDIFANWITEHYKNKDSHFIITSTKLQGYKAIFPIGEIQSYFDISAVVRRKRSGTAHVPRSRIEESLRELESHLKSYGLEIAETKQLNGKLLVKFNKEFVLKKSESYFGSELDLFLSPHIIGESYYIKRTSKTNNLNVIFSLKYKGPEKNFGIDLLEGYIQTK